MTLSSFMDSTIASFSPLYLVIGGLSGSDYTNVFFMTVIFRDHCGAFIEAVGVFFFSHVAQPPSKSVLAVNSTKFNLSSLSLHCSSCDFTVSHWTLMMTDPV